MTLHKNFFNQTDVLKGPLSSNEPDIGFNIAFGLTDDGETIPDFDKFASFQLIQESHNYLNTNLTSHEFLSTFEFNVSKIIPIHKCKLVDFAGFSKVEKFPEDYKR